MEDFVAQNFKSAATEKFGAALAEEGFVGSPDAYELAVCVQFKEEFIKGFNESDEGVKRVAARATEFPLWESKNRIGEIAFGARFG